ncbi:MAG: beta-galactosidase [Myxococcales bacterium]|nr:beta-galactosidase [Myxococcales bacterium]
MRAVRAASVALASLDPSRWSRVVDGLAGLGFDTLDLPLVWRDHDRGGGRFDFQSPRLNVAAFLKHVEARGLRAVVRLGPGPVEGLEALGLPERVVRDPNLASRTRRNNPRVTPAGLRLVPLPSRASRGYRFESRQWVSAALRALEPARGLVDAVLVGEGRAFSWRDEACDGDHHPDAVRPEPESPVGWLRASATHEAEYLEALAQAVVEAGFGADQVVLSVSGPLSQSPVVPMLAPRFAFATSAPGPRAGLRAIWREMRFAEALPRGALVTLHAGATVTEAPVSSAHRRAVAELAFAAGVERFSVHLGAAGDGAIGALVNAEGEPRPHAARWQELVAQQRRWPRGTEWTLPLSHTQESLTARLAALPPSGLPLGLFQSLGLGLDDFLGAAVLTESDSGVLPRVPLVAPAVEGYAVRAEREFPLLRVEPEVPVMSRCVATEAGVVWVLAHDHSEAVTVTTALGERVAVAPGRPVAVAGGAL